MIIIDPSSDFNIYFGRLLILISEFSSIKDDKRTLTVERIVLYDFLLKYPLLLAQVIHGMNKRINIDIKSYEVDNISSIYPNFSDLYKFNDIKSFLQIFYAKGLINISKEIDGSFYISISEEGLNITNSLESDYFLRIKEITKAISLLQSSSFSTVRTSIKSLIYGN